MTICECVCFFVFIIIIHHDYISSVCFSVSDYDYLRVCVCLCVCINTSDYDCISSEYVSVRNYDYLRVCVCLCVCGVYQSDVGLHALQHTATHCNTLQHIAAHCNTLQNTATHCNTLRHDFGCGVFQSDIFIHTLTYALSLFSLFPHPCLSVSLSLAIGNIRADKISKQNTAASVSLSLEHVVNRDQGERERE